jgi:hypothetical protein
LIIGSSRSGTALDPVAMQDMLAYEISGDAPTAERIALGHSPLRASLALLDNYLRKRGEPRVIVLEVMFMTPRSIDRLNQRDLGLPAEQYVFRRDINVMTFGQILGLPSVAMPYTEIEGLVNRWRFRLRGTVLRAGALVYQFLRRPGERWRLEDCDDAARTREPEWPADFAFSYGDFEPHAAPEEVIKDIEFLMAEIAPKRELKPWQVGVPERRRYPYDFASSYRKGELALLESMLELASRHDIPVVLLPMPLYGYVPGSADLIWLESSLPGHVHVFDLYGRVRADLTKFWYDDGHIEVYPAGVLTTALLADHLSDAGLLAARESGYE